MQFPKENRPREKEVQILNPVFVYKGFCPENAKSAKTNRCMHRARDIIWSDDSQLQSRFNTVQKGLRYWVQEVLKIGACSVYSWWVCLQELVPSCIDVVAKYDLCFDGDMHDTCVREYVCYDVDV